MRRILLACLIGFSGCTATSTAAGDALRAMVTAVNAGDAHAYAQLYADDAVIAIYGTGEIRGRPAIEQHEVGLLRQFPGAKFAIGDLWSIDGGAAAVARYAVACTTSDGKAMGHEGLLFLRFLPSGRIAAEHRYQDALTPMAQLGLLPGLPVRPVPQLPAAIRERGAPLSSMLTRRPEGRAYFAAWDAGDLQRNGAVAEDLVVNALFEPRADVGLRDAQAMCAAWHRAAPDASTTVTSEHRAADGALLVEAEVTGTLQADIGPLRGCGHTFTIHRAAIFDGGRVLDCFNRKELAEAVGQWPLPAK